MAATESVTMVQMEEKLRGDAEGTYRDYVLGRFAQLQSGVQAEMDRGLAPDDFESFNRIKLAAENAQAIVKIIWARNAAGNADSGAGTGLPSLL
ncbi:hypothetical protein DB346_23495 [Verrucomicrobia bacterium LW23]|nr:hypothetical protein DB346_23495 [Verrucomicrobia bacterium LW23]